MRIAGRGGKRTGSVTWKAIGRGIVEMRTGCGLCGPEIALGNLRPAFARTIISGCRSGSPLLSDKEACVRYAEVRQGCAWITTTRRAKFEVCCVGSATQGSGIYEITLVCAKKRMNILSSTKQLFAVCGLALLVCGAGCSTLFPKAVELGQDKVKAFPEPKAAERETQRQAARMAADAAEETLIEAVKAEAPESVLEPAADAAVLTEAVAESVGPPMKPAPVDVEARQMAAELRTALSKLDARIEDFRKDNNENAGKKIEGTGFLQIPYFMYVALVGAALFVGLIVIGVLWSFVKMYALSNPPVQLGVNAVQMGAGFLKRALSETVKGGEKFKEDVRRHVKDPATIAAVKEAFRTAHEKVQSADTQALIQELTRKE